MAKPPRSILVRWLEPASQHMAAESEPTLEWLTSDGTLPQHGGLAELAAQCRPGTALRVAVPGDAMTLTEVQLPAGKRALWRKATPYALEDSLAEPVEQLHFALAERPLPSAEQMADDNTDTRTARIPVAVVRRATLQRWLARFKQHGLSPAAMVPEPLLLPYQPGTWSVLLDAEHGRAVVRTDAYAGFSCELALLPTYLRLALTASRPPPERLITYGAADPSEPLALDALGVALSAHQPPLAPLQTLVYGYDRAPAVIDLLQGEFGHRARTLSQGWLRPWRAAALLAGIWVAVQGLQQGVSYWQLQREQQRLRQAITEVFTNAVPQARRIVNPRVQLDNRLRELRQAGDARDLADDGSERFFTLLGLSGQGLRDLPAVQLRGLRYRDRRLELLLEGRQLEHFDQLRQRLTTAVNAQATGVKVDMQTAKRDDKVESRVMLDDSS